MKIIEAMKRVKMNKQKISDLQTNIDKYCANLSYETPTYGTETANKINEWLQSCTDLSQENVKLLTAIQRTNSVTDVSIILGDKSVTKTIAEWVWRRREYAAIDWKTWSRLTDRGLREGFNTDSAGNKVEHKIVRFYDPVRRDKMVSMYRTEPTEIDSALEVVNAITDLIE